MSFQVHCQPCRAGFRTELCIPTGLCLEWDQGLHLTAIPADSATEQCRKSQEQNLDILSHSNVISSCVTVLELHQIWPLQWDTEELWLSLLWLASTTTTTTTEKKKKKQKSTSPELKACSAWPCLGSTESRSKSELRTLKSVKHSRLMAAESVVLSYNALNTPMIWRCLTCAWPSEASSWLPSLKKASSWIQWPVQYQDVSKLRITHRAVWVVFIAQQNKVEIDLLPYLLANCKTLWMNEQVNSYLELQRPKFYVWAEQHQVRQLISLSVAPPCINTMEPNKQIFLCQHLGKSGHVCWPLRHAWFADHCTKLCPWSLASCASIRLLIYCYIVLCMLSHRALGCTATSDMVNLQVFCDPNKS